MQTAMIHVFVTEEDICLGEPGLAQECMVHRALRKYFNHNFDVGQQKVYKNIDTPHEVTIAQLPIEVQKKINMFDHEKPVEPFDFLLEVPADSLLTPTPQEELHEHCV